jgi:hypothetical protein
MISSFEKIIKVFFHEKNQNSKKKVWCVDGSVKLIDLLKQKHLNRDWDIIF